MRKIIIFQHVAHEILGTLNPLLKAAGFRIRYVNFGRDPNTEPNLDGYNGLIVLGGPMGAYDGEKIPHIATELKLIESALKKNIPVLGICLGAQMIAQVLGAHVRRHEEQEIGWYDVKLTEDGSKDPLFDQFKKSEKIFELHADTFDVPKNCVHLAWTDLCQGQAFRYGDKVYGFQFHLEVDEKMIHRWLRVTDNLALLEESKGKFVAASIEEQSKLHIARSLELSTAAFSKFIGLFNLPDRPVILDSGHGEPRRRG